MIIYISQTDLLIWHWTLCGAFIADRFQINSSSFDFAQCEWVETSSGHFLQRRRPDGWKINQLISCQRVTWPSITAAGGWPQCDLMLSVVVTSTSFALIVKECLGEFKIMHISGMQTLDFASVFLVYFPSLCKCLTGDADWDQEGTENASEWKLEFFFFFVYVIFTGHAGL